MLSCWELFWYDRAITGGKGNVSSSQQWPTQYITTARQATLTAVICPASDELASWEITSSQNSADGHTIKCVCVCFFFLFWRKEKKNKINKKQQKSLPCRFFCFFLLFVTNFGWRHGKLFAGHNLKENNCARAPRRNEKFESIFLRVKRYLKKKKKRFATQREMWLSTLFLCNNTN